MMSISTTLRSGVSLDQLDRLPAVGGAEHLHVLVLEHASSARRCCARRRRRPAPCGRAAPRSSRAAARACCCFGSGRSATTRCRNSAVSSNSRSGDCTSLSTMLLATALQPRFFLGGQVLAGEDDDRARRAAPARPGSARAARSRSCRAGAGRRTQQSNGCVEQRRPAPRRRCRRPTISMSSCAEQLDDALPLDVVVLDDQQPLACAAST